MTLAQEILAWDGKSAAAIGAVYTRHHRRDGFVAEVIVQLAGADTEKGASWLLKHHLEGGETLKPGQISKIHRMLPSLSHWESRLHLLQCSQYLPVAKADKLVVERFLRDCLGGNNKFIRAWAYDGLYRLASRYPALSDEVRQLFEMALRDEAPSVKARIRRLMTEDPSW